jgi:hypothetical protein
MIHNKGNKMCYTAIPGKTGMIATRPFGKGCVANIGKSDEVAPTNKIAFSKPLIFRMKSPRKMKRR